MAASQLIGFGMKFEAVLYHFVGRVLRLSLASMLLVFIAGCIDESRSIDVSEIYVIDGDTIQIAGVRHRLLGLDTPEIFNPLCDQELVLGQLAKSRLTALIIARSEVDISSETRLDKYVWRQRL